MRAQLDDLGATGTRIVVTSDLDEFAIAALAAAPVDSYGVGTELVTGSGHPTCGFVYKLVAREDDAGRVVSVAKKSLDKISLGGRKYALRALDRRASPRPRSSASARRPVNDGDDRPLLVELVRDGEVVGREPLDAARDRHRAAAPSSRGGRSRCRSGEPVIETVHV